MKPYLLVWDVTLTPHCCLAKSSSEDDFDSLQFYSQQFNSQLEVHVDTMGCWLEAVLQADICFFAVYIRVLQILPFAAGSLMFNYNVSIAASFLFTWFYEDTEHQPKKDHFISSEDFFDRKFL